MFIHWRRKHCADLEKTCKPGHCRVHIWGITQQQLELSLQIYRPLNYKYLTFGFSSDIATVFVERVFGKLVRPTLFAFLPPSGLSSPPLTGTCLGPPLQMYDWFWQDHVTSKRRERGYGSAQLWKRHNRENWRSRCVLSISKICVVYILQFNICIEIWLVLFYCSTF